MATITAQFGEPVRQYGGEVQVRRSVKVKAPGRHFKNLTPAEQGPAGPSIVKLGCEYIKLEI